MQALSEFAYCKMPMIKIIGKRQIKLVWLRSLRLFKIYMNKGGFLL